ncbi:MAG TPA: c-type cytochrome [Sedimenticola sp.]|nr:c-type cytochrome [Sedimenticola sp.]
MKSKTIQAVVFTGVFSTVVMAPALAHETPTAPADWLAKTSPYTADDLDMKKVKKLYKRKCKKCHGSKGNGKGSGAQDLEIKPPDFTVPEYKNRKDGQMFWIMMNGSEGTDMEKYGPGTYANISEDDLWKLVTYIKAVFPK